MKRQDAAFAHPQKKRTGICHKSWYVFVCGREAVEGLVMQQPVFPGGAA